MASNEKTQATNAIKYGMVHFLCHRQKYKVSHVYAYDFPLPFVVFFTVVSRSSNPNSTLGLDPSLDSYWATSPTHHHSRRSPCRQLNP